MDEGMGIKHIYINFDKIDYMFPRVKLEKKRMKNKRNL